MVDATESAAKVEEEVKHDVQYDDDNTTNAVTIEKKEEQKTGTEGLQCIYKMRVKLYRFREEWKERGIGNLKLMRDSDEKRVRCIMRQEKTLKPVANFILNDICTLTKMQNSEKAWCWSCTDFSDGEASTDKLAARFNTVDAAKEFETAFNAARIFNLAAAEGKDDELVYAEAIEDIAEVVEDDIDTNKTADAGGEDD